MGRPHHTTDVSYAFTYAMIKTTHSGLVESAPYTYPFGLLHSVRLYSLLVL